MNKIMQEYYPLFESYQALRGQLLEIISDEDLAFQPGGDNPTLGALCRKIGEVERSYLDAFKTFHQDFSYSHPQAAEMERSVAKLAAWFGELDAELKATIAALTDEDIVTRVIDRGPDFKLPPNINLTVYNEALLIFYGKVNVYLKAMGKERPPQWVDWIG